MPRKEKAAKEAQRHQDEVDRLNRKIEGLRVQREKLTHDQDREFELLSREIKALQELSLSNRLLANSYSVIAVVSVDNERIVKAIEVEKNLNREVAQQLKNVVDPEDIELKDVRKENVETSNRGNGTNL